MSGREETRLLKSLESGHGAVRAFTAVEQRSPSETRRVRPIVPILLLAVGVMVGASAGGHAPWIRRVGTDTSSLTAADDDECTLSSLRVVKPTSLAPLMTTVEFTLSSTCQGAVLVTAKYKPMSGSTLPPLYAPAVTVSPGRPGSASLFRLRPATLYSVELMAEFVVEPDDPKVIKSVSSDFMSPSTGVPRFDEAAYGEVTKADTNGSLGFSMLTFACDISSSIAHQYNSSHNKSFSGIVATDAEGWVVWVYQAPMLPTAWDFIADNIVFISPVANTSILWVDDAESGSEGATEHHWSANTQVAEINPRGELQYQLPIACTGRPLNSNGLSHECVVEPSSAASGGVARIWTLNQELRRFPNTTVLSNLEHFKADVFAADNIVEWDRGAGRLAGPLVKMFDVVDPTTTMSAENTWATSEYDSCSGGETTGDVVEFTHVDSIAFGTNAEIVVASRALNAVFAFHRASGALIWALGAPKSNLGTPANVTYRFPRESDAFYGPHAARIDANGDLVLMDDGNNRPGCLDYGDNDDRSNADGCFSRAVRYEFDHELRIATLKWQFEWPVLLDGPSDDHGAALAGPTDDGVSASVSADDGVSAGTSAASMQYLRAARHDLYNDVGGSAYPLSNGNTLVGYTSISKDTRAYDPSGSMYAFEVGADRQVEGMLVAPACDGREEGGYRMKPWSSVGGESVTCPLTSCSS